MRCIRCAKRENVKQALFDCKNYMEFDLYNMMDGITIYDASGNYQRPLDIDTICETTESIVGEYTPAGFGYYLIQTADKVIKYDTSSKKETEICTYNTAMTDTVSLDKDYGVYVNVNSNAYGTSVVKTYFADGNLQMLESNANVEYNYKILSQYGYQDGDTYVRGAVFYISEKNNYTDTTQYTYYTYETTSPIF